MDKREAKRVAYREAAEALQEYVFAPYPPDFDDDDRDRLDEALSEIIQVMEKRGYAKCREDTPHAD